MTLTEEKTKDDILNEEIEQEHKEAKERNKNVNVEVGFAPKDEQEEFCKKINDKNFFAVETTLTVKLVDFIDITEFNSQPITGGEYQKKLYEFIRNHKRFNSELSNKFISLLKESGLFLTYLKESGQDFNPLKSSLQALKDSLLYGDSDCLEKIFKSITPTNPQKSETSN